MPESVFIRQYKFSDANCMAKIFYNTIHNVNSDHYTEKQLDAWAPKSSLEPEVWQDKWEKSPPIVALINNKVIGFAEFQPNGYIDCFFVHHEFQSCGAGSALMREIERVSKRQLISRIYAEVSITARPFFERKGFVVTKKQNVILRGVGLINYVMEKKIPFKRIIRNLCANDIPIIVKSFEESGWTEKPSSIFEKYIEEQNRNERVCWVAFLNNKFAGYVTLTWHSQYKYFSQDKVPEISDLNVLPAFRRFGIGSALINECEKKAASKSEMIGIGVGLYPDYGEAQRLYIKRGYIPDGRGATYNYQPVIPGCQYTVDDDFILWFTKLCHDDG